MPFDPNRISQVEPAAFRGTGYRHLALRYSDPLSGEGARIHGGRYTPPQSFPTLYLCTTHACVVAEYEHLAIRQGLEPEQLLPRVLYRYRVDLDRVLDLTTDPTRAQLGVNLDHLVGADWSLTQQIGDTAHRSGFDGVLAPSALGVDDVLAVFIDTVERNAVRATRVSTWRSVEAIRGSAPPPTVGD